jgi:hypothetical protein
MWVRHLHADRTAGHLLTISHSLTASQYTTKAALCQVFRCSLESGVHSSFWVAPEHVILNGAQRNAVTWSGVKHALKYEGKLPLIRPRLFASAEPFLCWTPAPVKRAASLPRPPRKLKCTPNLQNRGRASADRMMVAQTEHTSAGPGERNGRLLLKGHA